MSERNSMNDMFGKLRDLQVEAPLDVMDLAIAKANRKRKWAIWIRWSSLLCVVAVLSSLGYGLMKQTELSLPNSPSSIQTLESPAPALNSVNESSKATAIEANAEDKIETAKSIKGNQKDTPAVTPTTAVDKEVVGLKETTPSTVAVSTIEADSVSTVAPLTLPESTEKELKKTAPKGQRKLKLIIPQP
jgi:hypothetical protein